jgi:hypothetical protein
MEFVLQRVHVLGCYFVFQEKAKSNAKTSQLVDGDRSLGMHLPYPIF